MKKVIIFISTICFLAAWYWIIIVQIAAGYNMDAAHYYDMASSSYRSGNTGSGSKWSIEGDKMVIKSKNTLSLLPQIARP